VHSSRSTTALGLPKTGITPLSSFIFKVATRCNLDCTYCYEYNMGDDSWKQQPHFAQLQTVKALAERVKEHALDHRLDFVAFSFHGGEPLLAGAAFFREAATIIRDTLGEDIGCSFGVQTNGTLITEEIVELFSREKIHIGLSLDGAKAVNDQNRIYASGRGSFDDVIRGVRWLLTPAGREVFRGILCVIDHQADPLGVFEFLASLTPPSIDFLLPHGNWSSPPPGKSSDPASATTYADWLIPIFDSWFEGNHADLAVRTFEEIIEYQLGGKGHLETLGLSPVSLICIAADGSIESVDTLKSVFPGAHKLDMNIYQHSFNDVLQHPMVQARQIGLQALCEKCVRCHLVATCGGGYFPHRWSNTDQFNNPSVYCADYIKLISHIQQRVAYELSTETTAV
jgi:uncharacterized protein